MIGRYIYLFTVVVMMFLVSIPVHPRNSIR